MVVLAAGDDAEGVVLDGTQFKLKDTADEIPGVGRVLNFANLHKVVPVEEYKARRFSAVGKT